MVLAQTDWPAITTAVVGIMGALALLIGAISAAIVSIKTAKAVPRIEEKIKETVHLAVKSAKVGADAAIMIEQIDTAVNGKAPGERSMVKEVSDIHHEVVKGLHEDKRGEPAMADKVDDIHTEVVQAATDAADARDEVVEAAAVIVADNKDDGT